MGRGRSLKGVRRVPFRALFVAGLLITILVLVSPFGGARETTPEADPGPLAPGFNVTAEVTPYGEPLAPYNMGTARVEFTVTCEPPGLMIEAETMEVWVDTTTPWLQLGSDHRRLVFKFEPQECLALPASFSFTKEPTIQFTKDAPVGETATIEVFAKIGEDTQQVTEWSEQVGFAERWTAKLDRNHEQITAGDVIELDGSIKSNANGPLMMTFKIIDPPAYGTLVLPDPFMVDAWESVAFQIEYRALSHDEVTTARDDESTLEPFYDEFEIRVSGDSTHDSEPLSQSRDLSGVIEFRPLRNDFPVPSLGLGLIAMAVLMLVALMLRKRA